MEVTRRLAFLVPRLVLPLVAVLVAVPVLAVVDLGCTVDSGVERSSHHHNMGRMAQYEVEVQVEVQVQVGVGLAVVCVMDLGHHLHRVNHLVLAVSSSGSGSGMGVLVRARTGVTAKCRAAPMLPLWERRHQALSRRLGVRQRVAQLPIAWTCCVRKCS